MRVLLTTDTVGGVWTYTKELTEGLLERGCAVALVSFGGQPSAEQAAWSARIATSWRSGFYYEASSLPLEWMQDNSDFFTEGAELLLGVARHFQVDVLHSNQFCFGALPTNLPKIVAAHSDVLSWAKACCADPLTTSPWLHQYVRLVQCGLNSADYVVAPTAWMLAALRSGFPFSGPSAVIANGRTFVDASIPVRRDMQAVTAGRLWDKAKGLSTLLEVSAPLSLVIAGDSGLKKKNRSPSHRDGSLFRAAWGGVAPRAVPLQLDLYCALCV